MMTDNIDKNKGVYLPIIRCGNREFRDIQGIVFDKDGTLEDSRAFWYDRAIARIQAIESQIPGLESLLTKTFGIGANSLNPAGLMAVGSRRDNHIVAAGCIASTGRDWLTAMAIAKAAFQAADEKVPPRLNPLYPQCLEVIRYLHAAGLQLAILSSDTTARVEQFVKENHLLNYIKIVRGCDRGLSKPDPLLLQETCQALGTPVDKTLMVGDTRADWEMAKQAKSAAAIAISWQPENHQDLQLADVVIRELTAISVIRGEFSVH
ncbi:Similar to tr/Q4C8G8/Q4C8G8_CROWT HAD-superfamily hydrolase [Microcystis aeruginosa PCC 9432]|jgi:phosphoglycolate phosphatase|uniref:Similar to tr/Q4C8G8/Q4C8G8_CROWT HAD-superfamily hydrolase n=1 Tax=Microcystis aeruginosa PCC 9432 TaxID=1160280 RepID=A0A822LC13_MICAE|nr:HAD family hydrolase [Microcystis aeruginosa]MDB9397500.1 HAD family hydrolase [Microcystis aeruginosa CS-573]TRT93520.1 MAG: HAD family hydrolase [Microcystis aeruginosa Ma_OC_LR_19540900_S633]CCH94050.1 Similar to tr/Q4C8G8/Q4C8G8_CROWT HAD-superfamily hydrolase [Microcystis aeruginosa PCC 9432]